MRCVVCMTGASGAIYGIRLLQELPGEKMLVMSDTAKAIIPEETGYTVEQVEAMADRVFGNDDLFATSPPAPTASTRFSSPRAPSPPPRSSPAASRTTSSPGRSCALSRSAARRCS